MDSYGFSELNSIRKEANYRFYKDAWSYYVTLLFLDFDTKYIRQRLFNLIRTYRTNDLMEVETIRLLKANYSKDRVCNEEIATVLQMINEHYEVVYNYFEKYLVMIDRVIKFKDPKYFSLLDDRLEFEFYLDIQKKYTKSRD